MGRPYIESKEKGSRDSKTAVSTAYPILFGFACGALGGVITTAGGNPVIGAVIGGAGGTFVGDILGDWVGEGVSWLYDHQYDLQMKVNDLVRGWMK